MPVPEIPSITRGARGHRLRVVSTERDQLGEGPVWDDRERVLLRVDIVRGLVLTMREPVILGTTLSNGIGWSPDGETMYFVDSTTQRIDALDFDLETGRITNRRPWASIKPDDGLPDGLTVDAEGGVWLCLFGGAAIR